MIEEVARLNINPVIHAGFLPPAEGHTKGLRRPAMRHGKRAKGYQRRTAL
jgi:hypothetical protein